MQGYEHTDDNPLKAAIGLTAAQWEVFHHRLTQTDCFVDVFEETSHHQNDIEYVGDWLVQGQLEKALEFDNALAFDIIADCVEGGTFLGSIDEDVAFGYCSHQKASATFRVCEALAEKVSAYIGRPVKYPRY